MTRPIIGLVGRSRSGKDSFAARLIERHGFVRYAFADNVRAVAEAIDPIVTHSGQRLSEVLAFQRNLRPDADPWEGAKEEPEVRRLLKHIGTEGIRAIDPHFWVRAVMRGVKAETRPVVITDVRFLNEAEVIHEAGGTLVRIVRPDVEGNADQHVSETEQGIIAVDYKVTNAGTLDDLATQADWTVGLIAYRPRWVGGVAE